MPADPKQSLSGILFPADSTLVKLIIPEDTDEVVNVVVVVVVVCYTRDFLIVFFLELHTVYLHPPQIPSQIHFPLFYQTNFVSLRKKKGKKKTLSTTVCVNHILFFFLN